MSKTYTELLLATLIVLLFAGGVSGYLWSQQPDNLDVTTETLKKPGHQIGIIPQFKPVNQDSLSYYKISVETNQPHPDDGVHYSTTEMPEMGAGKAFWFENHDKLNNCAKVTTSVEAYDKKDQLIAEGESFDCVTSPKKFSQLSEQERQNLYPEAEQIKVTLRRYERNNQTGVITSWSHGPMKTADEYKVYTTGGSSNSNTYVPGTRPKSILLDIPTNSNNANCVNNAVVVEALDENDQVIGYGYTSECVS